MADNNTNKNIDDQLDFDLSDEILVKDSEGHFQVIIGGAAGKKSSSGSNDKKAPAPATSPEPVQVKQDETLPTKQAEPQPKGLTAEQPLDHQLAPPAPAKLDDSKTLFFFDVEDEEEIRKIAKSKNITAPSFLADEVAADIVNRSGLRLSAEQKKRVISILVSRLKQVREKHEALLRLVDKNIGGGLTEQQAEDLLKKVDDFLSAHQEKGKSTSPAPTELDRLIRQADDIYEIKPPSDNGEDLPEKQIKTQVSASQPATTSDYKQAIIDEIASKQPELMQEPQFTPPSTPPVDLPVASDKPTKEKPQAAGNQKQALAADKSTTRATAETVVKRKASPPSGKPRVEDVKVSRRLLGPIDELRYLSVDEFRRLGESAEERINKIKQKISILEEESFAQKIEGIKAWRTSPVYQLYLQIGRESMEQGKPVKDVIADRQVRGDKYLTWEEFTLISDLNQQLRF